MSLHNYTIKNFGKRNFHLVKIWAYSLNRVKLFNNNIVKNSISFFTYVERKIM